MSRQKALDDLDIFSPKDHPLPDGGFNLLLEALDIQDAAADLTKARIRAHTCTLPGAGGREAVEIYEERLLREVNDYSRKAELERPQSRLFHQTF